MLSRLSPMVAVLCARDRPRRCANGKAHRSRRSLTSPTPPVLLDIEASKQALAISKNADIRAFAEQMVKDHTAVNDQALALVKKLNVTPEDNATSKALTTQAAAKRAELAKLTGASVRQGLHRQRGGVPQDRERRARDDADSFVIERRAQEPPADRPEAVPGPSAARRTNRSKVK